jgi:hypothetical protein
MSKKLLTVLIAIALAAGITAVTTTAIAGPLPAGTLLSITPGAGSGFGVPCSVGSCFGMVNSGIVGWTDIAPGTDGGLIVGKDQAPGNQTTWPAGAGAGELTAAWSFFGNFGCNATAAFTATNQGSVVTSVTTTAIENFFDSSTCNSEVDCLNRTKLGTWHVAWNGVAVPMGSALGCKSTDTAGCIGVQEWTLTPSPVAQGSTYVLHHSWVVPHGDPSGFGDVEYQVILRGTITLPANCADFATRCDDGNPLTSDSCDSATGACIHTGAVCDDNNPCTFDTFDTKGNCLHINIADGSPCSDGNACTLDDACLNGACVGTSKTCPTPDACSVATCDTETGECGLKPVDCVSTACVTCTCDPETGPVYTGSSGCVNSSNNNFTMLDRKGGIVGGTNDVHFTYTKQPLTAVPSTDCGSGPNDSCSNATLSSPCPFFGNTWTAHDVMVYGPGTYTVYTGCPAGSPGCGQGTPITFTVGDGELGGHMLFNWSSSSDIDVVDIWTPHAAFGPSNMFTGTAGCGDNSPSTVWDLMSRDVDGDGVNGYGMVDGPFQQFNANFNLMETANMGPPSKPVLVFPADKTTGLPTTVDLTWKRSTDPDNDPITYSINICTDPTFTGCTEVPVSNVANRSNKGMFYAGGAGLFMIGITFIGGLGRKRRIILLLIIVVLFSGGVLISCNNSNSSNVQGKFLDIGEKSYTVSGLSTKTTYYWKVSASDGEGDPTESSVNSFTTQ